MALCRQLCFKGRNIILNLHFSTTCSVTNKWRIEQGLESNPREFSPLTNLPDYSFVDGRPAVLSNNKIRKLEYQKQICKRIVELTHEIDVGLEQYHEKQEQQRKEREAILKSKLKPKGAKLLSNEKS